MVTFIDAIGFDRMGPRRMPQPVREAREAALGLAGFGVIYPVVLDVTLGRGAAWTGGLQFAPGVLLGLASLGFTNADPRLRRTALLLAVLQIAVGLRVWSAHDRGVMPTLTVAYACGIAVAVVYLLCRPQAREWFGVG